MFSFREATPPLSPRIFLLAEYVSSHSEDSSFVEEKLLSRPERQA